MAKRVKPVVEVDEYSRVLRYFETVRDAALFVNCNPGVISTIINGYRKHYNGHKFRLAKPEEIKEFKGIIAKIDSVKPVEETPIPVMLDVPEPEEIPAKTSQPIVENLSAFERMLLRIQKKI